MSHTTTIEAVVDDPDAIQAACLRCEAEYVGHGEHKLFDGTLATGHAVKLADWCYPVIFGDDGKCHYDNYGGTWGDEVKLQQFRQAYSLERVIGAARAAGQIVGEPSWNAQESTWTLEVEEAKQW